MSTIHLHGDTHVGRVRTNNEDTFIATMLWNNRHALLAVIDGLGGYEGGEIAAQIARDTLIRDLTGAAGGQCLELLKTAVIDANNAIVAYKEEHRECAHMGCVLTAGIIEERDDNTLLHTVHVGDTRLYRYHQGLLEKLTHDHSLVGYREEIGELSEEEAMNHPKRNLVDRVVGDIERSGDEGVFIDAAVFPLEPGTQLLFCSDGLTDLVTSHEITRVLAHDEDTPQEKTQALIALALDHGGRDNVTVVVATVDGRPFPIAEPEPETPADDAIPVVDAREHKPHRRWGMILAAVVTLALLGAVGYWLLGRSEKAPKPAATPTAPTVVDTVAVSPQVTEEQPVDSITASHRDSLRAQLEAVQQRRAEVNDSLDAIARRLQDELSKTETTAP